MSKGVCLSGYLSPNLCSVFGMLGVVVLSWYPPGMADEHGEPTEDLVPAVMDAAHRHRIKVTGEKWSNLSTLFFIITL